MDKRFWGRVKLLLDKKTNTFKHYRLNVNDPKSISSDYLSIPFLRIERGIYGWAHLMQVQIF